MADPAKITDQLTRSERLRQRRYQLVPIDVPRTEAQGREPGESTTPAELAELISSIATVGLLQPLLLEDVPDGGLLVVTGERRLRAMRWGRTNLPDNPNFVAAPAVVCPGPLTEEERRVWQLVENLARTDLQPGELAAALLFERCAVLAATLAEHDRAVPDRVWTIEDPVRRWDAINQHRVSLDLHHIGAPWDHVIHRLGLQLSTQRARQLVRAFRALPAGVSSDMDAHGVQLASRLAYLRLDRGRRDAAETIWAALKSRGQTSLLTSAAGLAGDRPELAADAVVDAAVARKTAADQARAVTQHTAATEPDVTAGVVGDEVVTASFTALDGLLERLRSGERLQRFAVGSLQLRLSELATLLDRAA